MGRSEGRSGEMRKETSVPKTSWPKSIWLAPLVALALVVLPTMSASGSKGGAEEAEYVVLYEEGTSLASARKAVKAAGGQIVRENRRRRGDRQLGGAGFVGDAASQGALVGAARNARVGYSSRSGGEGRRRALTAPGAPGRVEGPGHRRRQLRGGRAAREPAVGHVEDPCDRGPGRTRRRSATQRPRRHPRQRRRRLASRHRPELRRGPVAEIRDRIPPGRAVRFAAARTRERRRERARTTSPAASARR